jgi:hypothetical protein
MSGGSVEVVTAVVGAFVATATFVYLIWTGTKRRAKEDKLEREALAGAKYAEGSASRNDEVRQLTFERDDARRERNEAQRRADEYERRWNDLRDRGHQ